MCLGIAVLKFVKALPAGSTMADIGCGNGRYLAANPGVKGVEGLKGFSTSVSPPSLNSLHFSPREAVEKNFQQVASVPAVVGMALNYSPVEGQTLHWSP